jgi:hypothetical protein
LHLLFQIGTQLFGAAAILALGLEGHPALQGLQELTGGDELVGVGDGVGSGHLFFCVAEYGAEGISVSGYVRNRKYGAQANLSC